MSAMDANQLAYAHAAFSWSTQSRLDEMRASVARLGRVEVLEAMRACRDLTVELQRRHTALADQAVADLDAGRGQS